MDHCSYCIIGYYISNSGVLVYLSLSKKKYRRTSSVDIDVVSGENAKEIVGMEDIKEIGSVRMIQQSDGAYDLSPINDAEKIDELDVNLESSDTSELVEVNTNEPGQQMTDDTDELCR
eukprot:138594_1